MKKVLFLFLLMILLPSAAKAEDDAITKFARGLTNVISAPGEYFVQISVAQEQGNFFQALFVGLINGTVYTVAREVAGVYDIVTFPIPIPAHYEPLMEPETVFKSYHDMK